MRRSHHLKILLIENFEFLAELTLTMWILKEELGTTLFFVKGVHLRMMKGKCFIINKKNIYIYIHIFILIH